MKSLNKRGGLFESTTSAFKSVKRNLQQVLLKVLSEIYVS